MSDAKLKWNNIYQSQQVGSKAPALVLSENTHLLPHRGRALELACGLAANAILLAESGLEVEAWDISDQVAEKINEYARDNLLALRASAHDLEHVKLPTNTYDVIVVSYYLERGLAHGIVDALKPGGLLFYQTFTRNVTPGYTGPSNPDFRLQRNELLKMFSGLELLVYREEDLRGDIQQGLRNEALLVAQKVVV